MMVVDASVAAKWILPEPGHEQAQAVLCGDEPLFAPELIRVEVASAITKRVRLNILSPEEAMAACDRWLRLVDSDVIELVPDRELLGRAIEHALVVRHALQDCLYLSAATFLGAGLFTADRTLADRGRVVIADVRLVSSTNDN